MDCIGLAKLTRVPLWDSSFYAFFEHPIRVTIRALKMNYALRLLSAKVSKSGSENVRVFSRNSQCRSPPSAGYFVGLYVTRPITDHVQLVSRRSSLVIHSSTTSFAPRCIALILLSPHTHTHTHTRFARNCIATRARGMHRVAQNISHYQIITKNCVKSY